MRNFLIFAAVIGWAGAALANTGQPPAPVQSVAGRTGQITLSHSDISDWMSATAGFSGGAVASVAGRTGAITLTHSDITDWTSALNSILTAYSTNAALASAVSGVTTTSIGAIPAASLGAANGVAQLNQSGALNKDVTQRSPSTVDDNRYYKSGDGYFGFYTNTIDKGDLWGYYTNGAFREWQLHSASPLNAAWDLVSAALACDQLSILSCNWAISYYALTNSFTGSPGTLYRLNANGNGQLATPYVPPAPATLYSDASFAAWDNYCAGTTELFPNSCYFVGNDQFGHTVTSDWGIGYITLLSGGSGASANGSNKTVSLNMNGCGSVGITAIVSGTITGGVLQGGSLSFTSPAAANTGQCIGMPTGLTNGQNTQTGVAGGNVTFTTYPTFTVTWIPMYAPTFPSLSNAKGLRPMEFNSWPFASITNGVGFQAQNRLLRVAGVSYNSGNSWEALVGTALNSVGYRTFITTTDGGNGINLSNIGYGMIGSVASNSKGCINSAAKQVAMQAPNTAALLINVNAGQIDCWDGNDYVHGSSGLSQVTTTGLIIGSPQNAAASGTNQTSMVADVVAMFGGSTPATNAAGYNDLNTIRIASNKLCQCTPQANLASLIDGASVSMNEGNESTQSWYRLALDSLRTGSGGSIGVRSYDIAVSGNALIYELSGFYAHGGESEYYYGEGCDSSPTCIMQYIGLSNDLNTFCTTSSNDGLCDAQTGLTGTASGTTFTLTGGAGQYVAPGMVLVGGTGFTGTPTIQGPFAVGQNGSAGTYTISPAQPAGANCAPCTGQLSYANVASLISGAYKNWIWQAHQLGTGYYATSATLQASGITGTPVAGDRVTLSPPAGSGITCQITITGTPQSSNPVLSVDHVNPATGLPDIYNIWLPDHGACFGGTLSGTSTASAGWVPSGGSVTSWGSTTFTLALMHETVPKVVTGRLPLQQKNFSGAEEFGVIGPASLGDAGLMDDIAGIIGVNNGYALVPAPTGCPTITSCAGLGTGYGADGVEDLFSNQVCGASVYSFSAFNPANTPVESYDGVHPTRFCQGSLSNQMRATYDLLLPYP
jgi:hypothetical protein